MTTPLIDRFAAFSVAVVITATLVQSIALLGHPRPAADTQVAHAVPLIAPAR